MNLVDRRVYRVWYRDANDDLAWSEMLASIHEVEVFLEWLKVRGLRVVYQEVEYPRVDPLLNWP